MDKTRMVERVFSAVGLLLLLLGLLAVPADAAGGNSPALQPSPRPAWYSTLTPPAPRTTPEAASSVSPPSSTTASVLPTTGSSWHARWLLGLGLGSTVVGLVLAVLGQLGADAAPPPEEVEEWPAERLYWYDN